MSLDPEFIVNNLEDLRALPSHQTSNCKTQYQSIARDDKLSRIATEKCQSIFHSFSSGENTNIEVLNRFRDLSLAINDGNNSLAEFPYSNLIIEEIDATEYLENQEQEMMKNLTIEEVEVTDYV